MKHRVVVRLLTCMFISIVFLVVSITACGSRQEEEKAVAEKEQNEIDQTQATRAQNDQIENSQPENNQMESEEENSMKMNIQIGDSVLTATLVQNSSTEALIEMLSEGPVTIEMNDYANMEKVGPFPQSLPRNDEQISTGAGDLILYQGNSFVIYYDTNSWNFTRLGKIDNMTQQELMDVLGDDGVTAVLYLQ